MWDFPKIAKESVVSVSDVFGFKLVKLQKHSPFHQASDRTSQPKAKALRVVELNHKAIQGDIRLCKAI